MNLGFRTLDFHIQNIDINIPRPTCEIHADCTYKNSLLGYVECTSRATLPWLFGYSLTDASPISSSSSTSSSSSSSSSSQAAKQPSSQAAAAAAAAAGAAGAATAAAAAAAVPSPKSSSSSSSRRAAGGPSDRYSRYSVQPVWTAMLVQTPHTGNKSHLVPHPPCLNCSAHHLAMEWTAPCLNCSARLGTRICHECGQGFCDRCVLISEDGTVTCHPCIWGGLTSIATGKAPCSGNLRHVAPLAKQEQEGQPPLIAPLLRRRVLQAKSFCEILPTPMTPPPTRQA